MISITNKKLRIAIPWKMKNSLNGIGTDIWYQWPNYESRLRTLIEREWWPSWGQTNIACFLLWVNQNQVFTTKSFFWIYILLDYNSTVNIAAYYIPSFSSWSISWLETNPHPDTFKWVRLGQQFLAMRRPTLNSWYGCPPPSTNDESASAKRIRIEINLNGNYDTTSNLMVYFSDT